MYGIAFGCTRALIRPVGMRDVYSKLMYAMLDRRLCVTWGGPSSTIGGEVQLKHSIVEYNLYSGFREKTRTTLKVGFGTVDVVTQL